MKNLRIVYVYPSLSLDVILNNDRQECGGRMRDRCVGHLPRIAADIYRTAHSVDCLWGSFGHCYRRSVVCVLSEAHAFNKTG